MVYVVLYRIGGVHGWYLDKGDAERNARSVRGVLVELPIAQDYRS